MHILITGANHPLGQAIATEFQALHQITLTDYDAASALKSTTLTYQQAELRTSDDVQPLLENVDVIVHVSVINPPTFPTESTEQDLLDFATRGTYILLDEARKAGVDRLVFISTLAHFEAYPDKYCLDESWQPEPAPNAASLAPYLAEITCREFAREDGMRVICLRLDNLDHLDGHSTQDALKAIEGALHYSFSDRGYRWGLYHISASDRFRTDAAEKALLSHVKDGA